MSHDQFAFAEIMEAVEEAERERADLHRTRVHEWFDTLAPGQKSQLGALFTLSEWLTCQALSAAAGDHHRSQPKQRPVGSANGADDAAHST